MNENIKQFMTIDHPMAMMRFIYGFILSMVSIRKYFLYSIHICIQAYKNQWCHGQSI